MDPNNTQLKYDPDSDSFACPEPGHGYRLIFGCSLCAAAAAENCQRHPAAADYDRLLSKKASQEKRK